MEYHCAVIDSGIGGLPYFEYINKQNPHVSKLYIADNAHFPYGEKTQTELLQSVSLTIKKIMDQFNPPIIVSACNTLSVSAIDTLQETFNTYFIKTLPQLEVAAQLSSRVGIIASRQTIEGNFLQSEIKRLSNRCSFELRADATLIAEIEAGLSFDAPDKQCASVSRALKQFYDKNIDTLILGCTHFLHIKEAFEKCNTGMRIIDSVKEVGTASTKLLTSLNIKQEKHPVNLFFLTALPTATETTKYRRYAKAFDLEWGGVL